MSPTIRAAAVVALLALTALFVPPQLTALLMVGALAAAVVDALQVRDQPPVTRRAPRLMARGVASPFEIDVGSGGAQAKVRQATPPDLVLERAEDGSALRTTLTATRRGEHELPPVAVRLEGPLGLGSWTHHALEAAHVAVFPDLPAARNLALAVREGRFREPGRAPQGALGLGTDFESIRDYLPDDDIRQVNWPATQRVGRPMSNQYRVDQDREVVSLVDSGRLMGAPLGDRTRLDAALDALCAVSMVADEVGDRCGVIAFDASIRRRVNPRRAGGLTVVRSIYDLEPTGVESDYDLAFRAVGGTKRAFVLVLTDLLEETAARPLVDAVPVLTRRHHVVVASAADTDLTDIIERDPADVREVLAASVAVDVLEARSRVAARLRRAGADVIEAPPRRLAAACVGAYLRAKASARL